MHRKFAIGLTLLALLGVAPLLSACYTARGVGQDVSAAGQGLSNTAEKHTGYSP